MKMLKTFLLYGLPILSVCLTTFYYTYYKTTHIGGEQGVTPVWYSKNLFYVYISRIRSSGGFFPVSYTETSRIEGADFNTFEYIDDGFAKDKNYFYYPNYESRKVEGIALNQTEPPRIVSLELSDTSLLYRKYYILPDAVFHVMKHNSVHYGSSFERVGLMQGSNINNPVWYPFDYETFTPFSCGYVKDKNGVYYVDSYPLIIIENADTETFTAKFAANSKNSEGSCYATDKNYQYYYFRGGKYNELEVRRKPLADTDNR